MRKILSFTMLGLMFASFGVPTAQAGGGLTPYDFVIDCSEDTNLTRDNTDKIWADYEGGSATVLTINCTYSCAYVNVDQPTSCGSAFFDGGAPHYFTVTGPALIHGYSPGAYGIELFFGTTADELNFTADEQPGKIVFNWSEIDAAAFYLVRAVQDPDVECMVEAPANSCTIRSAPLGETYSYTMSVTFDFEAKTKMQSMVATVDATRQAATTTTTAPTTTTTSTDEEDMLANSGSGISENLIVALLALVAGLLVASQTRRRSARS